MLLTVIAISSGKYIEKLETEKEVVENDLAAVQKEKDRVEKGKIEVEKEKNDIKLEMESEKEKRIETQNELENKTKELNNIKKKLQDKEKQIKVNRGVSRSGFRSVPKTDTSMKSYMSYTTITAKSSPQYKLQHSGKVHTDSSGFRRVGDMYCIAVGTFYAESIGTILEIKLENGNTFKAVVGDFKANKHTDDKNQQHRFDKSIIEFIVNGNILASEVKRSGNCSSLSGMEGNIESIKVIGSLEF